MPDVHGTHVEKPSKISEPGVTPHFAGSAVVKGIV